MAEDRLTNLSYLKEVTGGEAEIMREIILLFFDQIPEFREGLQNNLKEEKYMELGLLAHKAKSSVLTFGMKELGTKMKRLQLKTQKLEAIDTYAEDVQLFVEQIDQAKRELQEDLNDL